jgi:hypothetical protein
MLLLPPRGTGAVLGDVITHPGMLAVARLLLGSWRHPGIRPGQVSAGLGFTYPGRPLVWIGSDTACSPDLPTAGNQWRGRRTLTIVGPVAVLLLLEDRRDDCPHRAC